MYRYLKDHFKDSKKKNSKNKTKKKKLGKNKNLSISSLPMSDSQNSTLLNFNKYEEERMPNALSSLNDISFNENMDQDYNQGLKTPERVKKMIKDNKDENQKLQLITKEIYKVAQGMAGEANIVNRNQAEYISNCALKIMDIVNKTQGDKSLDTLLFEYEEQQNMKRYEDIGESIFTDSDVFTNKSKYSTPKNTNKQEYGSIVIRDNIKDRINLKNLKKQFKCSEAPDSQRSNCYKNQDIKTTATTSQRKKYEDEKADIKIEEGVGVNSFIPEKKIPFNYMENSDNERSKPSQHKSSNNLGSSAVEESVHKRIESSESNKHRDHYGNKVRRNKGLT